MSACIVPLISSQWINSFNQCGQLIVGYSGGLDSTVLLHVLASHPVLHSKITAIHINHGISSSADLWQAHCQNFCSRLGIHFITEKVEFDRSANIEEGARTARYQAFSSLLKDNDCLILGHHQDDQAETVLLQLFRGAGIDGLAAMSESGYWGANILARPLLNHSRAQLQEYANLHQLSWVEDESNQDTKYARNYLRQNVIPLLVQQWPAVVNNIARTAQHCQQAKNNLEVLAIHDLASISDNVSEQVLSIKQLSGLNDERKINILRTWLKKNQVQLPSATILQRLLHELIAARIDATPKISWGNVSVRRHQYYLFLESKKIINQPFCLDWTNFPLPLTIEAAGISLVAQKDNQGLVFSSGSKISVRSRRGGEEFFWHGQTKQLKKLFQEWQVPPWLRESIPLVYCNETLAMVVGYAVSDLFFKQESEQAWSISTQPFIN